MLYELVLITSLSSEPHAAGPYSQVVCEAMKENMSQKAFLLDNPNGHVFFVDMNPLHSKEESENIQSKIDYMELQNIRNHFFCLPVRK